MDTVEYVRRVQEAADNYAQRLMATAAENMGVARQAYIETIKVLLAISFAALPLLATVVGVKGERLSVDAKDVFLQAAGFFIVAILAGVAALLVTAYTFRKIAHGQEAKLKEFLEKRVKSRDNPDVLQEQFKQSTDKAIREGMFFQMPLFWFVAQVLFFLLGILTFFRIAYHFT